ncbi:MAG TPA: MogA/MoaB family molybdenum cofactor biosynthesis protein [Acidimicrobiales bacterium]|nr:MogA/MoaB family molybdenum cofactor biosynthesis protein [Acidimicrobiales bacterium]
MDFAAKILIVSDSAFARVREDLTGPRLRAQLEEAGFDVVEIVVVADGEESVALALRSIVEDFSGLVVTSGGTGFSPRDQTPEGTLRVLDREAPGLSEAMRLVNPFGRLSRARAGTAGRCLILNCPGSPKGAVECLGAVLDVIPHALALLLEQEAPHPPEIGGSTATSS